MNVQQLINLLETVKDKELPIFLTQWSPADPIVAVREVQKEHLLVQLNRFCIHTE